MAKFFEHPQFKALSPKWQMYSELFEGDPDVFRSPKYLPYHQLETRVSAIKDDVTHTRLASAGNRFRSELRQIRESNTHYTNFVKPVIDIWKGLYFKNDLQLSQEAKDMLDKGEALENIDGEGSSLQGFLRDAIFEADYLYGRPIILVEAPAISPRNKLEEEQLGARAYLSILDPRSVKDWQVDHSQGGKLTKMRYEYTMIAPRDSLGKEPSRELFTRVFELIPSGFQVTTYKAENYDSKGQASASERSWKMVDEPQVVSGFESLPIVWRRFSDSQVSDYAEEIQRHHKLESSLDNGLAYQAWQRLYASGINRNDSEEVAALTYFTVFLVPEGGTVGSIDPADPIALERRIQRTQDIIFKKAMRQLRQLPSDSRAAQSGDTLRAEQDNPVAIVKSKLGDYEVMLNEGLGYYANYIGKELTEDAVSLNDDITEHDIQQTIMLFQALQSDFAKLPETKKQMLKAMIGDAPLEDMSAVFEEIEAANFQSGGNSDLLSVLANEPDTEN